jgi:hypothetical protein
LVLTAEPDPNTLGVWKKKSIREKKIKEKKIKLKIS